MGSDLHLTFPARLNRAVASISPRVDSLTSPSFSACLVGLIIYPAAAQQAVFPRWRRKLELGSRK